MLLPVPAWSPLSAQIPSTVISQFWPSLLSWTTYRLMWYWDKNVSFLWRWVYKWLLDAHCFLESSDFPVSSFFLGEGWKGGVLNCRPSLSLISAVLTTTPSALCTFLISIARICKIGDVKELRSWRFGDPSPLWCILIWARYVRGIGGFTFVSFHEVRICG